MHVIDGLGYGGGAEESLVATLPLLRERGIDGSVVCVFERPGWQGELRNQGFSVTVLPQLSRRAKVHALRRLIQRRTPDVVHATLIEATLLTRMASLGLPVKRVDSLVNITYDPARQQAHGLSARRMTQLRTVDAVTSRLVRHFHVLTDAVGREARDVLHIPPSRITQIPRGRDTIALGEPSVSRRARVRSSLGLAETDLVVLNVGRHDPQKAKLDLVAAFEQVADGLDNAVLLIAGRDGSDTARLAGTVVSSRHTDRIRILGHRDDVPDLLTAADVFAFPSLYEGFGGALIEAMAMGCPIIGSDAAAVSEVLGHGDFGMIVSRGDVDGLARAMHDLLLDPARREAMSRRGRQHFKEDYDLASVADATAEFYREMMSASAPSPNRRHTRRLFGRAAPLLRSVEVFGSRARQVGTGPDHTAHNMEERNIISISDAAAFKEFHKNNRRVAHTSAETRLSTGSTYWVLMSGDRPAVSGWVSEPRLTFPVGELRTTLELPPGSRVMFDFMTDPSLRGHGHYTALLRFLKNHYAADDTFIFALTTNEPSLRGIRRAGFTSLATFSGVRAARQGLIKVGLPK
ncbi:glycosyltransferase family 4 protein [Nostocoides sp. F2B08]|uniref:glycosyltransferase family 4 protein n=1 Tax=Nostocoides sp. F2B08 TaxID=2653936 RepID=UPI00186ACE35|nr:glycosyltransferase family 4 protein [Tetrasphaera sp. F2B08]